MGKQISAFKYIYMYQIPNMFKAVFENNGDEKDIKHSLWKMHKAYLWWTADNNEGLKLPLSTFNKLASAEPVEARIMHEGLVDIPKFDTPGVIITQDPIQKEDQGGALSKRSVIFHHPTPITSEHEDTSLEKRLAKESGMMLITCVAAYVAMIRVIKDDSFWKICPEYFRSQQRQMVSMNDSFCKMLKNLIDNNDLVLDPNRETANDKLWFVRGKELNSLFDTYCKNMNMPAQKWKRSVWAAGLAKYKLHNMEASHMYNHADPSHPVTGPIYVGMMLKNDFVKACIREKTEGYCCNTACRAEKNRCGSPCQVKYDEEMKQFYFYCPGWPPRYAADGITVETPAKKAHEKKRRCFIQKRDKKTGAILSDTMDMNNMNDGMQLEPTEDEL
jgi:hypothetical protein